MLTPSFTCVAPTAVIYGHVPEYGSVSVGSTKLDALTWETWVEQTVRAVVQRLVDATR